MFLSADACFVVDMCFNCCNISLLFIVSAMHSSFFTILFLEQDKNRSSLTEALMASSIISSKTDSSGGSINIAIECAMNGNVERFTQCFDNESDPFHDSITSLINTRSTGDSKSPLDWAALIGNVAMVTELIKHGADVNAVSEKGRLCHCRVVLFFALCLILCIETHQLTCSAFIVSTVSTRKKLPSIVVGPTAPA